MTKEEAVRALNSLECECAESDHEAADLVLLQFLESNGFEEVAEAWWEADGRCEGFYYA